MTLSRYQLRLICSSILKKVPEEEKEEDSSPVNPGLSLPLDKIHSFKVWAEGEFKNAVLRALYLIFKMVFLNLPLRPTPW